MWWCWWWCGGGKKQREREVSRRRRERNMEGKLGAASSFSIATLALVLTRRQW
jgi:hypothetical protein